MEQSGKRERLPLVLPLHFSESKQEQVCGYVFASLCAFVCVGERDMRCRHIQKSERCVDAELRFLITLMEGNTGKYFITAASTVKAIQSHPRVSVNHLKVQEIRVRR